MPGSLKGENRVALTGILLLNVGAFFAVANGGQLLTLSSLDPRNLTNAIPAGIVAVLTGVLSALLPSEMKARLVFLRWNHPLPGTRAFTELGPRDSRVDMEAIRRRYGPLPTEPPAQNALWYRLFNTVEDDSAVRESHKAFLFTRDYCALVVLLLVPLGPLALCTLPSAVAWPYLGVLLMQALLAGQAARTHGTRLVTTVLARAPLRDR